MNNQNTNNMQPPQPPQQVIPAMTRGDIRRAIQIVIRGMLALREQQQQLQQRPNAGQQAPAARPAQPAPAARPARPSHNNNRNGVPPTSRQSQNKLIVHLAIHLEDILYKSASTLEEYHDISTLEARVWKASQRRAWAVVRQMRLRQEQDQEHEDEVDEFEEEDQESDDEEMEEESGPCRQQVATAEARRVSIQAEERRHPRSSPSRQDRPLSRHVS